jgi:hypothetical protein
VVPVVGKDDDAFEGAEVRVLVGAEIDLFVGERSFAEQMQELW